MNIYQLECRNLKKIEVNENTGAKDPDISLAFFTPKTSLVTYLFVFFYIGKDCSNRNSTPQKINQELPN